jgi:hypothetical protein
VDDWLLVDVVDGGQDSIFEFLFRSYAALRRFCGTLCARDLEGKPTTASICWKPRRETTLCAGKTPRFNRLPVFDQRWLAKIGNLENNPQN